MNNKETHEIKMILEEIKAGKNIEIINGAWNVIYIEDDTGVIKINEWYIDDLYGFMLEFLLFHEAVHSLKERRTIVLAAKHFIRDMSEQTEDVLMSDDHMDRFKRAVAAWIGMDTPSAGSRA